MARIVKGRQFVAVDFQGNEYNKFRMKQINGYWVDERCPKHFHNY